MRRFECKDVDDSLNQFVVILTQKLSDDLIIILQDLVQAGMHRIFLKLDGMVENDV